MSGKPCVGCGWCCISDQCEVSHRKYGYMKRCPDLFWDESMNRYICLLMSDPDEGEDAKRQLFEGLGCCAPLMTWRDDVRNRDGD
ncbi:hypothetical protein [Desulfovibrio sp. JC010]|uniref:hypothetical protein n=1 Tax=Desulfovibrio sp. JC010 TaxID=2593641 RepID=UPI0013D4C1DD|nr:hypothetical protein [Desulfovibrio sp. JC010]NDV28713.1 hypothetical protein [Desulfovibrio sp. JC010]